MSASSPKPVRPAHLLVGLELKDGWKVSEKLPRPTGSTGGNFSVGYIVERGGQKAFLKAFDYREAFDQEDPAPMLSLLTSAYNFERELLERCSNEKLSRIVRAYDSGAIRLKDGDPLHVVQYVIFELAKGDVRAFLSVAEKSNVVWKFKTLHHATTGLAQLHGRSIAHQDVKPSNVLVFEEMASKLADLGRASVKDKPSPHDGRCVAGANSYAPPELLYRFESPDWDERRLGCDLYLLGSLVFFFFTGVGATGLLLRNLDDALHPTNWRGMFHDALPFLIDAFEKALNDLRKDVPNPFADAVVELARQLCYPDPALRGHPKGRAQVGARFSLERYISEFNTLASRAEIEFRKVSG